MSSIILKDRLSKKLNPVYLFIIFFSCLLPKASLSESLPLISIDSDKTSVSKEYLKNNNQLALLNYAKELQVQSQIIAKDYFYIAQNLREIKAKVEIEETLKKTDAILDILTASINDQEIKNLLSYLTDTNTESRSVLKDVFSEENASLVIDYSETMYEGAQSIVDYLSRNVKNTNSLHDYVMQQKLVLQKINKYYIAYQAGFDDELMLVKLEESVSSFQKGLENIDSHKFVNEEQQFVVVRLKHYWSISRKFYEGMEKGELTLIVFSSTDHMMGYLDEILKFEKENA